MPSDGTMSGASVPPSADEIGQKPQQQMPLAVTPSGQVLPTIDPNQVTTKPRQTPGSGQVGSGEGTFDPAMNGSDGGPDSPLSPEPDQSDDAGDGAGGDDNPPPKMSARRAHAIAMKVTALTFQIAQEQPHLSQRQARKIAQAVVDRYPMVVQADYNPMDFGLRGKVPDGPLTNYIKNGPDKDPDEPGQAPGGPEQANPTGPSDGGLTESHPGASQHLLRPPGSVHELHERFQQAKPLVERAAPAVEKAAPELARLLPLLLV